MFSKVALISLALGVFSVNALVIPVPRFPALEPECESLQSFSWPGTSYRYQDLTSVSSNSLVAMGPGYQAILRRRVLYSGPRSRTPSIQARNLLSSRHRAQTALPTLFVPLVPPLVSRLIVNPFVLTHELLQPPSNIIYYDHVPMCIYMSMLMVNGD